MMTYLYRFFRGFLTIRVSGKNVSRFLNLCTRHGILLWKLENTDVMCCICNIYLPDFYKLRPILRKTKVRLRVEKRWGLPFFAYRYRARKVFVVIAVLIAVGVGLLSTHIWRIEVKGNSSISRETILNYLESKQIVYGVSRFEIDNDALELALRQDFEPVIWASVYEEGTKLVVSIQEKLISEKPPEDDNVCMDLTATEDAVVASVITRSGLANVKAGDVVSAGDILVCARQEILNDAGEVKEYFYQSADADVYGYVTLDYTDDIPKQTIASKSTGQEHRRFFIRFGDYQLTSPRLYTEYEDYERTEQTGQLCLFQSFYLPVYTGEIRDVEKEKYTKNISKKEAKEQALSNFQQFIADLEDNGVRILDKNVMMEDMGDSYHIYGKISVWKKITRQTPTEILKNPIDTEIEQEEKTDESE